MSHNQPTHTYPSAVVWLRTLLEYACTHNASDIHIDPLESSSSIKLRIDGNLRPHETVPLNLHTDGIGRLKILCQLRTDEHIIPQDGRFRATLTDSHSIDVRVSIVPSYFGESAVVRLLRDTAQAPTLGDLGMSEHDAVILEKILARPAGIILITGPTGSGKTTTLYTLLRMLNDSSRSIITIEDPIEYAIPGIRQVQVNHARGLTFAAGLRSFVRQDPDVIMVGEIRDHETAEIAIHTALTGHLVLSTLHTSDAATAIPRLIDMGIEPYLIASTLSAVVSQRLVRRICLHCRGDACHNCNGERYRGRFGVYEILTPHPQITEAIMERQPAETIRSLALKYGMRSMESDGLDKVEHGLTKIEEILAAVPC